MGLDLDELSGLIAIEPTAAENLARAVCDSESLPPRFDPFQLRRILDRKGFRFPRRNIIFHCLKGGASKTTLAYNSGFRLSQYGARVLLVDLDKQANSTQSLAPGAGDRVFYDVVRGHVPIADAIVQLNPHLAILPSSLENARLEMELVHRPKNPATYFRDLFAGVRDRFDFVVFDLPPDLSHTTYLATVYADTVCVPIQADEYSLTGMRMTLSTVEAIQKEFALSDQEVLVVWSRFDPRERSTLRYAQELKDLGNATLLPVVIRTDVTFKTAQAKNKSVFELRRQSKAREDIDVLARELSGLREYFGFKGEA